jgi:hypothetical protein
VAKSEDRSVVAMGFGGVCEDDDEWERRREERRWGERRI